MGTHFIIRYMSNKKQKTPQKQILKKPYIPQKAKWPMKPLIWIALATLVLTILLPNLRQSDVFENQIGIGEFISQYNTGEYASVLIDGNKAVAQKNIPITTGDGITKIQKDIVVLPPHDSLRELGLLEKTSDTGQDITTQVEIKDLTRQQFWMDILPTILLFVLFIVIAIFIIGRMGWVANGAMNFGRSRAKLYDKESDKVLFTDVAGAQEEKVELMEVVDFLKNPKKYKNMGAKIPKWMLLVGPPGTGKTLIARAVAWESNVPFLSISGSEFVEMFVWVGASRVRDLFEQAKALAPSIIFIDEIDAIGRKRGTGMWWGHDEREQTLNQILTEMDGFDGDTNVIIMAATNRANVLDKALLRPGRFDRKITINLPNLADREQILKVHAKNKPLAKNIDFQALAAQTVGFSGADLGNLLNESAIIAARHDQKDITQENITQAFEKIVMGLTKKSQVMNEHEKKITAYHEVGHALVGKLLPNTDPVHKVSIISRGGALGVTWFLPERDALLTSKAKYLDELATLYGWRVAEEVFFWKENITTGASNDIERATTIARNMVTRFGMDEEIWAENFMGNTEAGYHLGEGGWGKSFSEHTHVLIDNKVKEILKNAYQVAKDIIIKHKKLHETIAQDLLKTEELSKEQFDAYFA